MKCRKVTPFLLDHHERKLPETTKRMVDDHLSSCRKCREELKFIEKVAEGLKTEKLKEPSKDIWDNFLPAIKKALAQEKVTVPKSGYFLRLKYALSNRLTMLCHIPTIKVAAISGAAAIIFISFLSLQLAIKSPEIEKEIKSAAKSLEESVMKGEYPSEVIENLLTSIEDDSLFSKEVFGEDSYSQGKELYHALVTLVTKSDFTEEADLIKEESINGDHIYREIEELDEPELIFFSEELQSRYSPT